MPSLPLPTEEQEQRDRERYSGTHAKPDTAPKVPQNPIPAKERHLRDDGTPCECEMCTARYDVFTLMGFRPTPATDAVETGGQMGLF